MNGPSLEAIRNFKLKQEQQKREQDEKRIKEKLSTLEHRAAQGDRKAKVELKKIEKVKEEGNKGPELQNNQRYHRPAQNAKIKSDSSSRVSAPIKRSSKVVNFEDLMNLAKQNTNEIRKPEEPKPKVISKPIAKRTIPEQRDERVVRAPEPPPKQRVEPVTKQRVEQVASKAKGFSNPSSSRGIDRRPQQYKGEPSHKVVNKSQPPQASNYRTSNRPLNQPPTRQPMYRQMPPRQPQYRSHYYDEDDYDDDEYEADGFVVDEEDDDVQNEVSRTIRSVFKYDRRRADLREEELDRQYRAIGRVSTFEDLEREERRASKLAAQEDARAQKEEEERKRRKKLRLNRPESRYYD